MARSDLAACRLAGLAALVLVLAACAGSRPRGPDTYAVLAEASLPHTGLTREMLRAMGEAAREGAVAMVLEEVGRDHGYDATWRPGNRYYDRVAVLVERSMEPMLSRMDPTPLLERNLMRSLERNLSRREARELVGRLATPEGRRFTEYLDASMAEGMLTGIARRTPAPFRTFMVERLEPLRPRLEAARTQARLSEEETARINAFGHTPLGRKLGRAYLEWADSLRGEWTAQLHPGTQQVKRNLERSLDDLRTILREYEQWRAGQLRDA